MTIARYVTVIAGVTALAASIASAAQAQDLSRYRDFAFHSSVASVLESTGAASTEVSIIHARPQVIQELVWRPRYARGRSLEPEPVREIRLRFLDDQLFSVLVLYDAYEMEGLTSRDVIDAVAAVYGAPLPALARRADTSLARWDDGEFSFRLFEEAYPAPYRLVGVATALADRAQAVTIEAERLDRLDAPQREAAARRAERERRQAEAAHTRDTNKAGFRP